MSSDSVTQIYFNEISSVPAAAIFSALYFLLFIGFAVQSFRVRSRVYYILSLFCAILTYYSARLTSFIMRGVIAGSASVNVGLLVGEEILFNVGLFFLLNALHRLLFDRYVNLHHLNMAAADTFISEMVYRPTMPNATPFTRSHRMTGKLRFPYRLLLLLAIVLGSVGISQVYSSDDADIISSGNSIQLASTVIFLVLILYLGYQTVMLFRTERRGTGYKVAQTNFGARYGSYILMAISLLLLIREAYATATARDRSRANNEHLWYPLLALPELLIVMLFAIPGLVPGRAEMLLRSEPIVLVEKAAPPIVPAPSTVPQARVDEVAPKSDVPPHWLPQPAALNANMPVDSNLLRGDVPSSGLPRTAVVDSRVC
ncbi:hypothetical protein DXG01_015402 [Tephrocybe rancida]|nr:hypothetical protein DXG01_015402 [Tephrocybe rancida]